MSNPGFDERCMRRAFDLAWRGAATTQPNPRVGCVIVRDGEIVGEGWHLRAGEPHAEVLALREAGDRARGATAYVTLEPCNHHGRTPPCSEALVVAGVSRVVYATPDPDPRVDGEGAARLRAAGIAVDVGLLSEEGERLNRGFLSRLRRRRPWLRLKLAASVDGRTALSNGESRWITSEASRADVHRWRAESAAILTGSGTVLADDPRLDARPGFAVIRPPTRVVLDSRLRTPARAAMFAAPGETLLFALQPFLQTTEAAALASRGARIEAAAPAEDGSGLDLSGVLRRLAELEVNEVWVECGPRLAGALLAAGLVDELIVYLAPRLLGPEARPLACIPEVTRLADARCWRYTDLRLIGDDARLILVPPGIV